MHVGSLTYPSPSLHPYTNNITTIKQETPHQTPHPQAHLCCYPAVTSQQPHTTETQARLHELEYPSYNSGLDLVHASLLELSFVAWMPRSRLDANTEDYQHFRTSACGLNTFYRPQDYSRCHLRLLLHSFDANCMRSTAWPTNSYQMRSVFDNSIRIWALPLSAVHPDKHGVQCDPEVLVPQNSADSMTA